MLTGEKESKGQQDGINFWFNIVSSKPYEHSRKIPIETLAMSPVSQNLSSFHPNHGKIPGFFYRDTCILTGQQKYRKGCKIISEAKEIIQQNNPLETPEIHYRWPARFEGTAGWCQVSIVLCFTQICGTFQETSYKVNSYVNSYSHRPARIEETAGWCWRWTPKTTSPSECRGRCCRARPRSGGSKASRT